MAVLLMHSLMTVLLSKEPFVATDGWRGLVGEVYIIGSDFASSD